MAISPGMRDRNGEHPGKRRGGPDPISLGGTGPAIVVFLILIFALLIALGLRWLIF